MKKRYKLITTIASLCLALAMVVFGVYAATSVQITTGMSGVYFVSDDVFVDIKVEYFWGPEDEEDLFYESKTGWAYQTDCWYGTTYDADDRYRPTAATFDSDLTAQTVAYTSEKPCACIRITMSVQENVWDSAYFSIKTLPPTTGGSSKLVDSSNSDVSLMVYVDDDEGTSYTTANTAVEIPGPEEIEVGYKDWETVYHEVTIIYKRTLRNFSTTFGTETCWNSVIKLATTEAGAEA
ncbi:MAG: hypothetical protein J6T74_04345 [Clostridia bacterium]|nr:hypothetical protein [Clostridia bacterium]